MITKTNEGLDGSFKIGAANAGWRSQFRIRGSRHRPGMADLSR